MKAIQHGANAEIEKLYISASCWISYLPDWLLTAEADLLLCQLLHTLDWREGHIKMFGKSLKIPRLHAWYGDADASYGWSGQRAEPGAWNVQLQSLRTRLQRHTGELFNGVLANHYRNGSDCMHWHSDDEAELGLQPLIAALSLGAERRFALRHKSREHATQRLQLAHGSLLLMGGECQRQWQHALPRSIRITEPRVSLTYRHIYPHMLK